jgi:two-component system, NarL family, invasion response regulator UvrY
MSDSFTAMRILLVSPDQALRGLLREALGPATFAEAEEADPALQALRTGSWDVVLLDLRLPHTNGLVTLRWLRQVRPEVPVVVVTGLPANPYAGAAERAGAAGFVTREQARERVGGLVRALMAKRTRMGVERW